MRVSKSVKKSQKGKVIINPQESVVVAVENTPTQISTLVQDELAYLSPPPDMAPQDMSTPLSVLHHDLDMFMANCDPPGVVAECNAALSSLVNLPASEVIDFTAADTVDIIDLTADTPQRTNQADVVTDDTVNLKQWEFNSIPNSSVTSGEAPLLQDLQATVADAVAVATSGTLYTVVTEGEGENRVPVSIHVPHSTKRALSDELPAEVVKEKKKKRKYTKSATVTGPTPANTESPAVSCAEITKKPRQSKLAGFRVVPLTSSEWPERFGYPAKTPEPDQVFYPPGDNSTTIEVYHEPHIRGVSIRQYTNQPYERRVNLSANDFRGLYYKGAAIIEHHKRITEEAGRGVPATTNYVNNLDSPAGNTQVLVSLYRGKAKVHVGTRSYVEEMNDAYLVRRQEPSKTHCGYTVTLDTIKDIVDRVGPMLETYPGFYPATTVCD